MPPKVKFTKEEIIGAAVAVVREKGFSALTAREIAAGLQTSTRPIFTYYDSMEQLKRDVFEAAKEIHKQRIKQGLKHKIPFLGVGLQYIAFAREDPELCRLLFLTKPDGTVGSAADSLKMAQELVRESLMRIYNIDGYTADCYFRDLWLVVFSFTTLIVTGDCPYTDEEMGAILSEVSLSVCKAYKEIPGLVRGEYDKDAVFKELLKK
ncbi:MAG: TetR/AcrR family transcriptional regulator [Ruminiclostridium sp.]|nr:TetR/AcrR family transcriptional regulator [Ruminiclostridium sp.]